MKFRYKVLLVNIIVLSLGMGVVGYFMIEKNMKLAINAQVIGAIDENNIIQSNIEYKMLDIIDDKDITTYLPEAADQFKDSIGNDIEFYIMYDNDFIYGPEECPEELWKNASIGTKKYIITEEDGAHYLYVTSFSNYLNHEMRIINRREISSVYEMVQEQTTYFRYLLLITVAICSVIMYFISKRLTKPLEQLTATSREFGNGNYQVRVQNKSSDEIGELSETYNNMAASVEEHVSELNEMLVKKDQFVSDFTHEIKTPLTSIIGYADLLRSKEVSRKTQITAASYIFSEGKRLESMSMKLFDLLYTKNHKIEMSVFSSIRLAEEVKLSVAPSLKNKSITLVTDFERKNICGDIELLKSAIINLIDNARKASDEKSKIYFTGKHTDDGFTITVKDNGVGISEEHLAHICDEFYMVDKSRSRKEGGAGLGLSLASLIFSCHDAEFDIQSTLGEGTAITITLKEEDA